MTDKEQLKLECAKLAATISSGPGTLELARQIHAFVTGPPTEREEPKDDQ